VVPNWRRPPADVKGKMPDWFKGIIEGGKDDEIDDSTP
jgi:hypothetical protein